LGGGYMEKMPHQYQTSYFQVKKNDILLDVGCAEALFSLDVIDKVKKVILFESDSVWFDPLKATFENEIKRR
jgi:16S rRNA A1518/A1519 N6-dimethyltransferase RsmA/KsgA/DIM1 with predicted DNA glycosylase/AP lyase activity